MPIAESVTPDTIVSLETGERFKALERHGRSLSLTPTDYRRRWPRPNYAVFRSGIARALGRWKLEPLAALI